MHGHYGENMTSPTTSHTPEEPRGINRQMWWPSGSGQVLAALCVITAIFYQGLWLPGLTLVKRDAFWSFLPMKQYMVERLSSGSLPQWYPTEALGIPFIGATVTGLFHPFTAFYLILDVPDAYRATIFVSCLLGTLGAFALGRMLQFSRSGALVCGLAFALSGYVVSLTDNIQYLYSICVLPFFLVALERALTRHLVWVVVPALLWATVFLNGDIQNGYYFGFVVCLWIAMRAPGSYRQAFGKVAILAGLTVLLAAVQLGPALSAYLTSNRSQPHLFHGHALQWSTHPARLLTILAWPVNEEVDPSLVNHLFFGAPTFGVWAESLYLGVPVVGLALWAAWRRRDLWGLTLLGGLALVLSLGRYGGLYEVFYQVIPFWSAFRYPEKLMGFVALAVAMLAGAGCDLLRKGQGHPGPWVAASLLCGGLGAGLSLEPVQAWFGTAFRAPADLAQILARSFVLALVGSAAAGMGVGLLVAAANKGWLREVVVALGLVALITIDLASVNVRAYHTGPREAATFVPPLAEALKGKEGSLRLGQFRLFTIFETRHVWPKHVTRLLGYYGAEALHQRQSLAMRINEEYQIETVRPNLPSFNPPLEALLTPVNYEALARLNVKYFVGHQVRLERPPIGQEAIAVLRDYDLALFRNPVPVSPRAYLSPRPEPSAGPVDHVALFARPEYVQGKVDVIETDLKDLPGSASGGSASIDHYAPEEVTIKVETPQPAVLVLLDSFAPGWEARLETGLKLRILRANALVRAVVVPAGHHHVTFSYQTPLLAIGAWMTGSGILLCVAILVGGWWQSRSRRGMRRAEVALSTRRQP